jgi:cation diffusion facilitator family transporter
LHKPKSRLFHFGYAKIESFAAFIAAVVIVVLGAFIVYHAYERILHPTEVLNPEITMITLVAAGSISLHRAFRVRDIAKKYNLISLNLDAKNSIKDGSASFVGFASVLAGYFGIPYMDAIGSVIIAGYIFYMAYQAFKESTLVFGRCSQKPRDGRPDCRVCPTEIRCKCRRCADKTSGSCIICTAPCSTRPEFNAKRSP